MTEKELRAKVVSIAEGFLGCKESDGSHKKIIDLYNSHKPLARGLYASTPLGGQIPAEYYGVVAEILVEIFRMNKKLV